MSHRVLVVAAHPDDEVLGAGATIHRLCRTGSKVAAVLTTSESPTREPELPTECMKSQAEIGISACELGGFGCMALDKADHYELVRFIESAIRKYEPDVLITHHPADIHPDHRTTAACALEAARLPQRQTCEAKRIKKVLFMEVPSSTDWSANAALESFRPDSYAEIWQEDLDAKVRALEAYDNVIRRHPHPRSKEALLALAVLRGSTFGVPMAEAFQTAFGEAF